VFTADAADGGGWGFAVVYATYQVVQTWLWSSVWRQDRRDHSEFLGLAGGYVAGMAVSVAVILASALLPAAPRLVVWAGLGVAWIVGIVLAARSSRVGLGLTPTDSLVERFGLFTIIVLGVMPRPSSPGCWRCRWASASGGSTSIWWAAGCPEPNVSHWRTG
jgi:low temperature requirement protein LtrA